MTIKQFGTSKNVKYLENQLKILENSIDSIAFKMSHQSLIEAYKTIDALRTRLNSLTDPNHSENIAKWKSRQNGDW